LRCIKFSNYIYEKWYTYTTVISLPRHSLFPAPAKQIKKIMNNGTVCTLNTKQKDDQYSI